ncbi:hypothetical protein Tcan_11209 [Toxocara canis]|uniref:EF-hand domain-containing protein n=2 Tax=Toxocara canis TaxID=6265 RepID=A0A0B2W0A1_TOXCA|nr:hypothetical protein Tcan_11209 [Toxocara canis]VDM23606.1 unnamed protein product [Toxocara canis]
MTKLCWTAIFMVIAVVVGSAESRAVDFRLPDATLSEETPGEKFHRSDANKDGTLTFDEYLHMELPYVLMKKTEFGRYDANGDGFISRSEYNGHLNKQTDKYDSRRAHYFGQIYGDYDEDFDMKLSEEEIRKMIAQRFHLKPGANFDDIFRSFDSNNDGGLDIDEYIKFDDDMPLDEFLPDETKSASAIPPKKSSVHCDDDDVSQSKKNSERKN